MPVLLPLGSSPLLLRYLRCCIRNAFATTLLGFYASISVTQTPLKLGFSRHVGRDMFFSEISDLDTLQNVGKN